MGEHPAPPDASAHARARVARVTAAEATALLRSLSSAAAKGTTLAWCVEHAAGGDPVPAAWAACRNSMAMFGLLDTVGHPGADALYAQDNAWAVHVGCCTTERGDPYPRCLAEVRAVVPTLDLAAVLAAARRPA